MRAPVLVLSLFALSVVAGACSSPPPVRRDVVVGLVGEPSSVFADEPGARVLAAAVTEPLVAQDARGELVPRLAAEVPTVEDGGLKVVTDDGLGHARERARHVRRAHREAYIRARKRQERTKPI